MAIGDAVLWCVATRHLSSIIDCFHIPYLAAYFLDNSLPSGIMYPVFGSIIFLS